MKKKDRVDEFHIDGMTINRSQIEAEIGKEITDEEFLKFCEEIDGRINNYVDDLFGDLVEDLREGKFKA